MRDAIEKHVMQDSTTPSFMRGMHRVMPALLGRGKPNFGSPCIYVIAKSMHAIVNNQ